MGAAQAPSGANWSKEADGKKIGVSITGAVVNQFARDEQIVNLHEQLLNIYAWRGRKRPIRGMIYDPTCFSVYLTRPSVYRTSFSQNQRGLKEIS